MYSLQERHEFQENLHSEISIETKHTSHILKIVNAYLNELNLNTRTISQDGLLFDKPHSKTMKKPVLKFSHVEKEGMENDYGKVVKISNKKNLNKKEYVEYKEADGETKSNDGVEIKSNEIEDANVEDNTKHNSKDAKNGAGEESDKDENNESRDDESNKEENNESRDDESNKEENNESRDDESNEDENNERRDDESNETEEDSDQYELGSNKDGKSQKKKFRKRNKIQFKKLREKEEFEQNNCRLRVKGFNKDFGTCTSKEAKVPTYCNENIATCKNETKASTKIDKTEEKLSMQADHLKETDLTITLQEPLNSIDRNPVNSGKLTSVEVLGREKLETEHDKNMKDRIKEGGRRDKTNIYPPNIFNTLNLPDTVELIPDQNSKTGFSETRYRNVPLGHSPRFEYSLKANERLVLIENTNNALKFTFDTDESELNTTGSKIETKESEYKVDNYQSSSVRHKEQHKEYKSNVLHGPLDKRCCKFVSRMKNDERYFEVFLETQKKKTEILRANLSELDSKFYAAKEFLAKKEVDDKIEKGIDAVKKAFDALLEAVNALLEVVDAAQDVGATHAIDAAQEALYDAKDSFELATQRKQL